MLKRLSDQQRTALSLTLKLFVVAALSALLMSVVNGITADRIYQNQNATRLAAFEKVLPEFYEADRDSVRHGDADITPVSNLVSSHYDPVVAHGYCAEVTVDGYAGEIQLMVGVLVGDAYGDDGEATRMLWVSGVSITRHTETVGASQHGTLLEQFVDRGPNITLGEGDNAVDAISGATVSSRAIVNGVNKAVDAVSSYIDTLLLEAEQNG